MLCNASYSKNLDQDANQLCAQAFQPVTLKVRCAFISVEMGKTKGNCWFLGSVNEASHGISRLELFKVCHEVSFFTEMSQNIIS